MRVQHVQSVLCFLGSQAFADAGLTLCDNVVAD